jgi:hypothetical protein
VAALSKTPTRTTVLVAGTTSNYASWPSWAGGSGQREVMKRLRACSNSHCLGKSSEHGQVQCNMALTVTDGICRLALNFRGDTVPTWELPAADGITVPGSFPASFLSSYAKESRLACELSVHGSPRIRAATAVFSPSSSPPFQTLDRASAKPRDTNQQPQSSLATCALPQTFQIPPRAIQEQPEII